MGPLCRALCMALGKRHGKKDRSSKNGKVVRQADLLQCYQPDDPKIVHYTESSLRQVILYLFLKLWVPSSKYSSNGRNK